MDFVLRVENVSERTAPQLDQAEAFEVTHVPQR